MSDTLLERLKKYIRENDLFRETDNILLAISGGKDSVALADLFARAGYRYAMAHCNFRLRGEESERDEAFVRALAEQQGVPLHVISFDTAVYAERERISIQEAARVLRYEWFEKVRSENNYRFTATAHHQNDSVETLLINFFKGTGIGGLHGILPRQGKVIRPFLFASAGEIAAYTAERGLSYVEDSSNLSEKYTRNYIRRQVLPSLQKVFPEVERNLASNIRRFREAEMLYRRSVDQYRGKLVERRGDEYFISVLKLRKSEPLYTLSYELFRPFGFSADQCREVIKMLDSGPGRMIASARFRLIRDRRWLVITPLEDTSASHHVIEKDQKKLQAGNVLFVFTQSDTPPFAISPDPATACVDAGQLQYPLLLRRWKQGDYFYPLGMRKKKKLSRFFIDRKLSLAEKEKVWVLESAGRIVWVAGHRIDDRFRITPSTRRMLKIGMRAIQE